MMQVRQLSNPFRIPDLRRRLLFTAGMLALYRLGAHLPVPGVNAAALERLFKQQGSLFNFLDLFAGGALSNFAIFALTVFPYITASIIFSLAGGVPAAEGDGDRRGRGRAT
jgi:preprotein translocase subunit SecY